VFYTGMNVIVGIKTSEGIWFAIVTLFISYIIFRSR
jgi:Mg2+ and Co2+ transporter CorA